MGIQLDKKEAWMHNYNDDGYSCKSAHVVSKGTLLKKKVRGSVIGMLLRSKNKKEAFGVAEDGQFQQNKVVGRLTILALENIFLTCSTIVRLYV